MIDADVLVLGEMGVPPCHKGELSSPRWQECHRGTQECVRHVATPFSE